jgi:hypothetical protein
MILSSTTRKQGQRGCRPCTPNPRRAASASLRTISLDDSEHLRHNHRVSVASLRLLFTFAPECRSASLRNRCSPSPEYPPPTSKSTRDLQNRVGAHFVGESLLWDNGVSSIQLEEYSGDLDSSSIDFTLDDYRKWQEERHKQAIKKPSPDM